MSFFDKFADEFFFVISAIVILLVFCDWLIGEEKRKLIREKVGDLWIYLGEVRFKTFLIEDVKVVSERAKFICGEQFSNKRFFMAVKTIAVISSISLIYKYFEYPKTFSAIDIFTCIYPENPCSYKEVEIHFQTILEHYIKFIPIFALCLYVTLNLTLFFLKRMALAENLIKIILYFIFDLSASVILVFFLFIFYWSLNFDVLANPEESAIDDALNYEAVFIIGFPSLIYFAYIFFRLFIKFTRGALFPVVMLLLIRFHESRKGLLTNLSIGIGVIVKLVQQFFKIA